MLEKVQGVSAGAKRLVNGFAGGLKPEGGIDLLQEGPNELTQAAPASKISRGISSRPHLLLLVLLLLLVQLLLREGTTIIGGFLVC